MVRGNLGAAMQGFVVDPAVRRLRHRRHRPGGGRADRHLRRHRRPLRGEARLPRRRLRLGVRPVGAEEAARPRRRPGRRVRTAVEALYDAADDDTATGGPDLIRHIYPVVVSDHRADGAVRRPDAEIEAVVRGGRGRPHRRTPAADRAPRSPSPLPPAPRSRPVTMPFYSSVDQLLRDRSELARKGIARGRSVVVLTYTGGVLFVAENRSPRCTRSRRSTTGSGSRRSAATTSSRRCARGHPAGRRPRLLLRPARRHRPVLANVYAQVLGTVVRRAAEAVRGRAVRGRGRRGRRRATSSTGSPTTARSPTSRSSWSWAAPPTRSAPACANTYRSGLGAGRRARRRGEGPAGPAPAPGSGEQRQRAGRGAGARGERAGGGGARPGAAPRRAFRRITGGDAARAAARRTNRGTPDTRPGDRRRRRPGRERRRTDHVARPATASPAFLQRESCDPARPRVRFRRGASSARRAACRPPAGPAGSRRAPQRGPGP